MRSIILNSGVFLLALMLWFFIPHFFTGILSVISLIAVLTGFLVYIRKAKTATITLSKNHIMKLDTVCHIVAVAELLCGLVLFFVILASNDKHTVSGVGFIVCGLAWFGIEFCNLIASHTEHFSLFHGKRLLAIASVGVVLPIYPMLSPMLFGLEFSLRTILIPICLSAIISAFIYYQDGIRVQDMGDFKILIAIIISFVLSFSVNSLLDNTEEAIRYTRESNDTFRNSTICVTETGKEFSYHACPIQAGEWSWVISHEGWFQVEYFTELDDDL